MELCKEIVKACSELHDCHDHPRKLANSADERLSLRGEWRLLKVAKKIAKKNWVEMQLQRDPSGQQGRKANTCSSPVLAHTFRTTAQIICQVCEGGIERARLETAPMSS